MKKIALIGLGVMGNYYLQTAKLIPGCKIEQICAKGKQTLNKYPNSFKKTTDFKKIGPSDGIIIATPASTHYEIAKFFIAKKIPLLIEKPLALNHKDALILKRLATKNKVPVFVGHTLLYHPAYLELKKNIPKIGKIKKIIFEGANYKPRTDTNILYDWGPHAVSLVLDILKTFPEKIIFLKPPNLKKEISVRLFFPDNIEGILNLSWVTKNKKRKLIIEGDEGYIVFDDMNDIKLAFNLKNKIIFPKINHNEPLENVLKEFLKILNMNQKTNNENLSFAVKVIKFLDQIEKSAQKNS